MEKAIDFYKNKTKNVIKASLMGKKENSLYVSAKQDFLRRTGEFVGRGFLFTIASSSAIAVIFIFYFINSIFS